MQHDARMLKDGTVSLFDNVTEDVEEKGALSRGLVLRLDARAKTAGVAREYTHPDVISGTQGSMETLGGSKAFVGWGGMRPEFTEYAAPGEIAWDARFVPAGVESYRAYTCPGREPVESAGRPAPRAVVAHLVERGDGRGFVAAHAGRRADGDDRR